MSLIQVLNLTKTYKISGKSLNVLKDITLELPQSGLIVILGKSGSGKSTLLNIIGGIDKPTLGGVNFSLKKKGGKFSNFDRSFIFQHYHLLENETPLYNVMLPALIQGYDKKYAEVQAKELIKSFGLDESILKKETRFLSGGEKERIAILRSLITDPKLILADEPTGALDKDNAVKTMKILKNASKKRLVLLVTHNKDLAKKYADRIITISNGKIVDDLTINETNDEVFYTDIKRHRKNNWTAKLIDHNFKKRIKRNIVSIIGMTISLVFCYLLFGFSNNSTNAINEASTRLLSCLGAKDSEVVGIFVSESLIIVFFSFLLSTVISWLLQKPMNMLLNSLLDISNLIQIPIKSFYGIKGLLPLAVLTISIFATLLFTSIPILINKKVSLKKELTDL